MVEYANCNIEVSIYLHTKRKRQENRHKEQYSWRGLIMLHINENFDDLLQSKSLGVHHMVETQWGFVWFDLVNNQSITPLGSIGKIGENPSVIYHWILLMVKSDPRERTARVSVWVIIVERTWFQENFQIGWTKNRWACWHLDWPLRKYIVGLFNDKAER